MKDENSFEGWKGDLWDAPGAPDPWPQPDADAGHGRKDAEACRNYGIAAAICAVLSFAGPGPLTAAAALVLASMGMARGKDTGPGAARAGKGLCIAARIIAAIYFICMVLAIIFAAVVFGGIFYYAGTMKY